MTLGLELVIASANTQLKAMALSIFLKLSVANISVGVEKAFNHARLLTGPFLHEHRRHPQLSECVLLVALSSSEAGVSHLFSPILLLFLDVT